MVQSSSVDSGRYWLSGIAAGGFSGDPSCICSVVLRPAADLSVRAA
jgi:hypothetical protein